MTPSKMGSKNHISPLGNVGSLHGLNNINLNNGLNSKTPKEQYKRMQNVPHINGSNSNRANPNQMGSP